MNRWKNTVSTNNHSYCHINSPNKVPNLALYTLYAFRLYSHVRCLFSLNCFHG